MQSDRSFWPEWAHFLQQRGLSDLAAGLFTAAAPLHLLLAQLVFAGEPFLKHMMPEEHVRALESLFEDQSEGRSFAAFIREENSG
jgi:hypothetical protein